jgi:hypothetical protein
MANYINNLGQVRLGFRNPLLNQTIQSTPAISASLLQSLFGVWNGDTTGTTLDSSIYGVWNGEASNNSTVKNAWNANGNAIDSKSGANGTIVTPNSTTGYTTSSMTYSTGKLGTASFTFNGSNFVSLPANTFTFTSDFTVSCWFYVPTNYVSNAYLLSAFDNTGSYPSYFGWWLSYDSTNKKIGFSIGDSTQGSYGNVTLSTANNTITPGQWNHVMVTRKNSTRSRIYINGVLSTSNTNTTNPRYSNGWSSIGSAYFAFSQPFWTAANAGLKIEAVQTWVAELDQTVVTELYNSGNGQEYPFTISNALIPSPNDSVGTNHGTLVNGTTFTTGKVGNAFLFNGSNYVSFPTNSWNSVVGTDLTISLWVRFASTADQTLISNMSTPSINVWNGWEIRVSGGKPIFFSWNNSGTGQGVVGSTVAINTWYHIVATKRGTLYNIYMNGSLVATSSGTGNAIINGTFYPNIGHLQYSSTYHGLYVTNGTIIDSVNLWSKEISADEVVQLYNAGNGTQYPFSSQTLPSVANQFGVDNGTLVNGCTFGDGKIGKAFQFDGVNDYVALPNNSLNFTSDFSTSFWVYNDGMSINTWRTYIGCSFYSTGTYGFGWQFGRRGDDNNYYFYCFNGDAGPNSIFVSSNDLLPVNQWSHVVISRKWSTQTKIYINGVLSNFSYSLGNAAINPGYQSTMTCTIGALKDSTVTSAFRYIKGKMDSVNIWQKELTQSEITELYNSGNGKQITTTPIVQTGLILNLDASRKSSYPNTGTTWTDISGTGNNGTLTNGPVFGTASDGVISFDGVNDFVKIPLNLSSYSQITVEIWYKINPGGSNLASWGGMLWEHSSDWNTNVGGFGLSVNSGGCSPDLNYMHTNHNGGSGPMNYLYNSGTTWSCHVNIFSNIVDPTGRLVYVNGQLTPFSSTNTCAGGPWSTSTATTTSTAFRNDFLYISSRNGQVAFINGNIGLIRVYGRKLSATEVAQNFNATKS